jgi:hypothetical protein
LRAAGFLDLRHGPRGAPRATRGGARTRGEICALAGRAIRARTGATAAYRSQRQSAMRRHLHVPYLHL